MAECREYVDTGEGEEEPVMARAVDLCCKLVGFSERSPARVPPPFSGCPLGTGQRQEKCNLENREPRETRSIWRILNPLYILFHLCCQCRICSSVFCCTSRFKSKIAFWFPAACSCQRFESPPMEILKVFPFWEQPLGNAFKQSDFL